MKKDSMMRTGKLNKITLKDYGKKIGYFDCIDNEIEGIMEDYYKSLKYYIIGRNDNNNIKLGIVPINSAFMEPVKVIQFYGEEFEGIKTAIIFDFNQKFPGKKRDKRKVKILLESSEYDLYNEKKEKFFKILKLNNNYEIAKQLNLII